MGATPLTTEQYVQRGGNICPVCLSDQTEGDSYSVVGAACIQECHCNNCGAGWEDVYQLSGYQELEVG